jgi:hypothetical protein
MVCGVGGMQLNFFVTSCCGDSWYVRCEFDMMLYWHGDCRY